MGTRAAESSGRCFRDRVSKSWCLGLTGPVEAPTRQQGHTQSLARQLGQCGYWGDSGLQAVVSLLHFSGRFSLREKR